MENKFFPQDKVFEFKMSLDANWGENLLPQLPPFMPVKDIVNVIIDQ